MSIALAYTYTANNTTQERRGFGGYDKIKASDKWVQYSLDLIELTKSLQTAKFEDKFILAKAIKIAKRKRDYMYRHPNFNLSDATFNLRRARSLLKL